MNDLVDHPLAVQFEPENRACGRVELAMPDPHEDRRVALEAAMVDSDGYFDLGQLGVGILISDRAYLEHLDGKAAVDLDVRGADRRIADLDIVAELEIAAFRRQPGHGSPVAQGTDVPKVLAGAAVYLSGVQNHLLPVKQHGV